MTLVHDVQAEWVRELALGRPPRRLRGVAPVVVVRSRERRAAERGATRRVRPARARAETRA
jgi:hypothetical protein